MGYTTVRLPASLTNRADDLVGTRGYRSRAEIVTDALRRFLDREEARAGALVEASADKVPA